jgi:hypothetical protein
VNKKKAAQYGAAVLIGSGWIYVQYLNEKFQRECKELEDRLEADKQFFRNILSAVDDSARYRPNDVHPNDEIR